jgi:hypothetical protein
VVAANHVLELVNAVSLDTDDIEDGAEENAHRRVIPGIRAVCLPVKITSRVRLVEPLYEPRNDLVEDPDVIVRERCRKVSVCVAKRAHKARWNATTGDVSVVRSGRKSRCFNLATHRSQHTGASGGPHQDRVRDDGVHHQLLCRKHEL